MGAEPPLIGVAVNVALAPAHCGLLPDVIAMVTDAGLLHGAIWYEKILVLAALPPVVPPIYSLVFQNVMPSISSVVCE